MIFLNIYYRLLYNYLNLNNTQQQQQQQKDTACQIAKLNESFGSFFFGAAQDQFGNYHIKSPNDFLYWNNGVPHV